MAAELIDCRPQCVQFGQSKDAREQMRTGHFELDGLQLSKARVTKSLCCECGRDEAAIEHAQAKDVHGRDVLQRDPRPTARPMHVARSPLQESRATNRCDDKGTHTNDQRRRVLPRKRATGRSQAIR